MKKQTVSHKLLRVLLAGVLASGLMIPTAALATEQEATAEESATSVAPSPQADDTGATAGDFLVLGGSSPKDFEFANNILHIKTSTPLTVKMAPNKTTTAQTIQIDAGTQADLTLAGVNIVTANCAPINMITNSDEDGDGVKVTNAYDIVNKTKLHLTLADGTTNKLQNTITGANGWPAIRCGWGSVLVIDDAIRNLDTNNQIVTPKDGMIGEDVTLIGGQTLKAGDPITNMDSANPGVLDAQGGGHSACIGSGPRENAGTIIINGGTISAKVSEFNGSNWSYPNGSGIGGGAAGSGTIITINGGNVTAVGGSCGTGIGAGFGYYDMSGHHGNVCKPDAIEVPTGNNSESVSYGYSWYGVPYDGGPTIRQSNLKHFHTVAGDISINGGYINVTAAYHGNAVGQCCAHGPAANKNHVIRITGGTLITSVPNKKNTDPYLYGIGARNGYTLVTGGSVFVEDHPLTGKPMFQGIGDTAFNTQGVENWEDIKTIAGGDPNDPVVANRKYLPDSDKVQMLAINLSSEFDENENSTVPITKWKLQIDNQVQNYGAPSYLHNGELYLWLPESATGKNVTVTLSYRDDEGVEHSIEPMYVEEVGGDQGSLLKRYINISIDKLSAEQQAYFSGLSKNYDGLPFEMFTVSESNPLDTSPFEEQGKLLKDPTKLDVSYQQYAKRGDELPLPGSEVIREGVMPADSGVFKFEIVSREYSETKPFSFNYWGHRITGWAEVYRVPAILDISSTQYGTLSEDGTWTPTTKDSPNPGNRIRLDFNIHPASSTAKTCEAPTGAVQVTLDGKPIGEPIALTKEVIEASAYSSFEIIPAESAPSGRATTKVVYYLDPTRLDGELMESGTTTADGTVHKVSLEYIADKNYIKGVEDNPSNADTEDTFIVPVAPTDNIEVDGPDDLKYDSDSKTVTGTYTSFQGDAATQDFFNMNFVSTSAAPVTFTSSNPAVADIVRDENGNPVYDENGNVKINVLSCGTCVITMDQPANALYTGQHRELTVNILPDPSLRPSVQIRLIWKNITALESAPAAQSALFNELLTPFVEAGIITQADDSNALRALTPPRPGDTIEYTVSGLNLTPGSSWQAAELKDVIDDKLIFDATSVELASNYPTPEGDTSLSSNAFYQDFDWESLDWSDLKSGEYTFNAQTLSKVVGSVFGGQSTSVRFRATVPDGLGTRPSDGELPTITNTPSGSGGFGKEVDNLNPGEEINPPEDLVVGTDIVVVPNNDATPPAPGMPVIPEPTPILPKDPNAADIVTKVTTEIIGKTEQHTDDRILVGDTIRVTSTTENIAPDSKLVDGVVKLVLPVGYEPKPGTITLVDAQGNRYTVDDSAYDPETGIIAVVAGDIYGGEKVSLSVDVDILSTKETREAEKNNPDGNNPNNPSNPDDPSDPNNPSDPSDPNNPDTPGDPSNPSTPSDPNTPKRPEGPGIEVSILGQNPTDEWIGTNTPGDDGTGDGSGDDTPGDGDDNPKPHKKPTPGSVYVPDKPWSELEEELISTPTTTDPDMPIVLPASPKEQEDENGPADIVTSKTAQNLTRDDGDTHVGDTVRYTVTVKNTRLHTAWYETIIRDEIPQGLELVPGSIQVIDAKGQTYVVDDSAYNPQDRVLAATVGDLLGNTEASLIFDVTVSKDAIGKDVGNIATAHGTTPAGVDVSTITNGASRFTPGQSFVPEEGWNEYLANHPGAANRKPVYPSANVDANGGILDGTSLPNTGGEEGGSSSAKESPSTDLQGLPKADKTKAALAETGDTTTNTFVFLGLAVLCAGMALMMGWRKQQ